MSRGRGGWGAKCAPSGQSAPPLHGPGGPEGPFRHEQEGACLNRNLKGVAAAP